MKLSKEELKKRIDEVVSDDEIKISLLEDIEDSVDVESAEESVPKATYDEVVAKYEDIKQKYKERFLSVGESESAEEETEEEKTEELKEEEVVDVKEI